MGTQDGSVISRHKNGSFGGSFGAKRILHRACAHLELDVTEEAPQKNMAIIGIPMATTAPVPVP